VRIDYLRNNPVFESHLAELSCTEWQHLYGNWHRDAALREFESQRADGRLPLTLVAIEQDELLGAVSLIFDDLPGYEHLNPWLASLLVLPEHRGEGVGSRLVREAEKLLASNGVETAYLFTETAHAFFERLGWQVMEQTSCHGLPIFILRKRFLNAGSPR
jgi:predicted N-acetyltransferase YhbS